MQQFNNDDVLFKIIDGTDDQIKKEQEQEAWETVYSARQNRSVLKGELRSTDTINNIFCGIVYIGHVKGLIPLEYSGFDKPQQIIDMLGKDIYFKVINLDREAEIFTGSRIAAIEHLQGLSWDRLREGMKLEAKILRVSNRTMKLDIGAIETDIHVENVSHEWIDTLTEHYKAGQILPVKVMKLDKEAKVLLVSHKELLPNPWPDCTRRYQRGTITSGRVSGVVEYGVFVNLEAGVDALCPQPGPVVGRVKKGDKVKIKISNVDANEGKIAGRIRDRL